MEERSRKTPEEILQKKFRKDIKGYDADQVDEYLDELIQDYLSFQHEIAAEKARSAELEKKLAHLAEAYELLRKQSGPAVERVRALEVENASLHQKLDGIRPGDAPTAENMEYIQRIRQLEAFLYSEGYDPVSLKRR